MKECSVLSKFDPYLFIKPPKTEEDFLTLVDELHVQLNIIDENLNEIEKGLEK